MDRFGSQIGVLKELPSFVFEDFKRGGGRGRGEGILSSRALRLVKISKLRAVLPYVRNISSYPEIFPFAIFKTFPHIDG